MEAAGSKLDVLNDNTRFRAVSDLREQFGLDPIDRPPFNPSPLTVGIEIEMTWRQTFPELAEKWPTPSKMNRLSTSFRQFSGEYNLCDKLLRPTLQSISKVIPRVGFDAYWEFSFLPTKNISVTTEELRVLYDLNILQNDQNYSLHMTVAGIDNDRDAFAFLCCLEMAGGTNAERIHEAMYSKKGAWARKGSGGVMKRKPNELIGEDTIGYEFRSLTATSQDQINLILNTAADLSHLIHDDYETWKVYRSSIEQILLDHGLTLAHWPIPKDNPQPWLRYIELLDSVK